MSRPAGTPFWGESIQVDSYAFNVTGSALPFVTGNPTFGTPDHADASAVVFRGPLNHSAPSATLASGDAIQVAAATSGANYVNDGDTDLHATWVVEVLAGSGVLSWSQSLDYGSNGALVDTPVALGSMTITGPGTYTLPAVGVTPEFVLARAKLVIVTVACTSGSVQVQQVKMRLWPEGGPLGGLTGRGTEAPASEEALRYRVPEGATGNDSETTTDYDAVWTAAWNQARSLAASGFSVNDTLVTYDTSNQLEGSFQAQIWTSTDQTVARVELHRNSMWFIRPLPTDWVPTPPGVDGVDYIRNPYEVAQDPAGVAVYDSPPVTSWESVVVNTLASIDGSPPPSQNNTHGYFKVAVGQKPIVQGSLQLKFNTVGMGTDGISISAWPASDTQIPLAFPDAEVVRLTAVHEYYVEANPAIHGSGVGSVLNPKTATGTAGGAVTSPDGTPVKWHVEFSPFSYWVPGPARPKRYARLLHRGDGLGMSTRRLVNGTHTLQTGRLRGSF